MKLEITVFGNEKETFVRGYMGSESFYENAQASAKRIGDKAHIEIKSETTLFDENQTEENQTAVDLDICCNIKTLAIAELIKAMAYDYCLPETIVIKNIRK